MAAYTIPYMNGVAVNNLGYPYANNMIGGYAQQDTSLQNMSSLMAVIVQGEAVANSYPVASGSRVMLIDFDDGKFWLKSNVNGIPQRLRSFTFKEEIQEKSQQEHNNQSDVVNINSEVTKEEFNSLVDTVAILSNNVNKLISELGGVGEDE